MPRQKELFYLDLDLIDRLHADLYSLGLASSKQLETTLRSFLAETETDPAAAAAGHLTETLWGVRHLRNPAISKAINKIKLVVEKIKSQHSLLFNSLPHAADLSIKNDQRVLFYGQFDRFDGKIEDIELAIHDGLLPFRCYPDYVESDNYFKTPRFKAEMFCSLSKTPHRNGFAFTGNLAHHFRTCQRKSMRLKTFCALLPCKHLVQLKPLAIWF